VLQVVSFVQEWIVSIVVHLLRLVVVQLVLGLLAEINMTHARGKPVGALPAGLPPPQYPWTLAIHRAKSNNNTTKNPLSKGEEPSRSPLIP
jgi:hypothetical protein